MTSPQKLATDLLKVNHLQSISDYACTAFCVLWYLGIDMSDADAISTVNNAIEKNKIQEDCTVVWKPYIEWLTGRNSTVSFVDIKSLADLHGQKAIVRFTQNGFSHWVGVENGEVVFDPLGLGNSKCVAIGRPVEARIIEIAA